VRPSPLGMKNGYTSALKNVQTNIKNEIKKYINKFPITKYKVFIIKTPEP
jgi:hypothetical protein